MQEKLSDNLYKVWNRLSSGSYFPPAVKEVEIPKKDGGKRLLGIPTIGDRVAQMVVKDYLEPRLEKEFLNQSYGYRPLRNAYQALEEVRKNCWQYNWVIDLDIKGFFDNIDHQLLKRALEKHVDEKWVLMYVDRWLQMPVQKQDGQTFLGFDLAISKDSRKKIVANIRSTNLHRWTNAGLEEIAQVLNPRIQGWVNYYGKFRRRELGGIFRILHHRLMKWILNKYKSLKVSIRKAYKYLKAFRVSFPSLFIHWRYGFTE